MADYTSSGPSFPPHVITPTFWALVALILFHTFTSIILKCTWNSCTYWLHPHLTTATRKTAATAIYTAILAVELIEGFYILKTDQAFWAMVAGGAPAGVPCKENLSQWMDWLDGAVASGIPIGVTLVLGVLVLGSQGIAIRELVGFKIPAGREESKAVVQEKKQ
ncbi:hypothetical protein BDW59DRAFT_140852 [Aspergillus cavernicola]|uniref:Uncharacterized protein n=1 Tax=Aspergillus cavernicola TaxID=176166 RepID=A0ABR4IVA1_9EURO